MFNTFKIAFGLKNTYRVNSIIYSLKQFPILKQFLSNKLYHKKALKILGNILSIGIEIGGMFLGKILYLFVMIVSALSFMKTDTNNTFLHMFVFLTIIGGIINSILFNPTKDKYYAMFLMRMDARQYTLSEYFYKMLKIIIGFLPFTIILGTIYKIPIWICFVLPIFVVMIKMMFNYNSIRDYQKRGKVKNENTVSGPMWGLISILLLLTYGLPYVGITINQILFGVIFSISIIAGIYSWYKMYQFKEYRTLYQAILIPNNMIDMSNMQQYQTTILKENTLKQIQSTETSNKTGFAYFHELFIKRHAKILTKSAKKTAIIIGLIGIALLIITQIVPELNTKLNNILLRFLPYFVFIMYAINRGTTVTQAMFMNCDYSMLTYQFYKTPKTILGLFRERLKTLMKINLIPALVIALGLPILLYMTGGTENPLNYLILFISILAMSIFFSVHYLVLYYLLQPYNVNIEIKSSTYTVAQSITYLICFFIMQKQMSTMLFGILTVIFSILYCIISLILVYRLAPKTFRLRT